MLSTTIDWSQQPQMNGATENPTRPMSSFQIRSTDGRKLGSATAADQQAAAAAAPLKCPRCDSSNTKFCYYNNYSLSQPRHFCKACKRYWTRGGMLRNVPVGGGCRKSKQRVSRQPSIKLPPSGQRSSNNISHEINGPNQTARSQGQNQIEDSNLGLNGLLYGKNSATMEICNGFGASRVTDMDLIARVNSSSGYNQITNLGLGSDYMRNQYDNSSYPFSAYSNLFSSNLSSSPAGVSSVPPALMRSIMLGNINGFEQAEKFVNELSSSSKEHFGHFLSALPLEDMHIGGSGHHGHLQGVGRGMKVEELGQMNKFNQMGSLSSTTSIDPPSLQNWINGASNMNTWSEVPNIGSSSVMSLL